MEVAGFLALGILVGLLGALLGIGGGMVIVPLLVFAWDYEPQLAIGTSVLVVLMNAVSGTWGYVRQKKVCVDAALKFAVATVPGAFLGSYAAEYLQGRLFYLVFGAFFVLAAINMYRKANKEAAGKTAGVVPEVYNWKLGVLCSVGVGFFGHRRRYCPRSLYGLCTEFPGARGHCYFYLHFGSFLACRLSFACYAGAYCVDQRLGDWCGCLCRCSGRCSLGAKAAVRHFDEAGERTGADYRH